MARLYYHDLVLNEHFPRAVLHGPADIDGMDIPSLRSILTTIRINYFLYHTRQQSQVGLKLELSTTHLQIETGLCQQVLSMPFSVHGHLGTHLLVKCIWHETSNHNMYLAGHTSNLWTPHLQGTKDNSIMEFAVMKLGKEEIKLDLQFIYVCQL